jgi:hypothetical protein
VKFHASASLTAMRQYPSFRSTLENINGVVVSFDNAVVQMMRGMTFPSSNMASCFADNFSEELLRDSRRLPLTRSWNDRSSIIRYLRDLWGTAASGDNFRFVWKLSLMSIQLTSRQEPSFTRLRASFLHAAAASGMFALACAQLRIAASSCSRVQLSPQSTGQPSSAYCSKSGPAGCKGVRSSLATGVWCRGVDCGLRRGGDSVRCVGATLWTRWR